MSQARIGLIGTGWWATSAHLPALQAHPRAQVAAICDLDAVKLARAAAAFGIERAYSDISAMLAAEQLDGVMVATHHAAHYPLAKLCLEAGLHVFIEKPMTLRALEARELVGLAARAGREIVMGYNHCFSEWAPRARHWLQSELGALHYIHGIFSQPVYDLLSGDVAGFDAPLHSPGVVYSDPQRSGGGHGHLQITHLAGVLAYLTGLRIERVQSLMAKQGLQVDVVTAILAQFEGGALATLGGTGKLPGGGRSFQLTLCCEGGWLEIDDDRGTLSLRRPGQETEHISVASDYPYFAPIHHFVDVILGRASNQCSGEIGWRAVELLDAAYRSAERGGAAVTRQELYKTVAVL